MIVKVQPGTLADGKLKVGERRATRTERRQASFRARFQIGDRVLKVNDRPVQDANAFFQRLLYAPPLARITVLRDEKTAAELESKVNIPPERAKLIQRRDGYTYFVSVREQRSVGKMERSARFSSRSSNGNKAARSSASAFGLCARAMSASDERERA